MHWIDSELKARGKPRRALMDAVPNLTEKKISEIFSGRRRLTADEADDIRRWFGYRMPQDPPTEIHHQIDDLLARVHESQRPAVILYLEALAGSDQEHREAS